MTRTSEVQAPVPIMARRAMPTKLEGVLLPTNQQKYLPSMGRMEVDPNELNVPSEVDLTQTVNWKTTHQGSQSPTRSHTRASSTASQHEQRKTLLRQLGTLVRDVHQSITSDFRALGTKFSMELTDIRYESDKKFGVLSSLIASLESVVPPDDPIPMSPLEHKAYEFFEPTTQLVDQALQQKRAESAAKAERAREDYHRTYKEVMSESLESQGPTRYYSRTENNPQPIASGSGINRDSPVNSSPQCVDQSTPPANTANQFTSAGRNKHVINSQPRSPKAATVSNAEMEDDIVYLGSKSAGKRPIPPSSPIYYPPDTAKKPGWVDRVAFQRMRNDDIRRYGQSAVPDQGIGFDADLNPVDKHTTPRSVWDRGQRDNPPEDNYQHYNNNNNNDQRPTNQHGGVSGRNPGDPRGGDDSSDDDRRSRRSGKPPSKKPEPKKRRHTPWEDESSSDEYASVSDYSIDSLESFENDLGNDGAGKHGRNKLEDYSRRLWVRKIHHKYRSQIREQVGEASPVIEGLKALKVNEPKHYKGQGDVEIFEAWLLKVLRWMSVNRLAGPEAEKLWIQCIGMLLGDKALQWYDDEVASPHRTRTHWTFKDVIIGIFDHCVQMSTVQEAATQFDNVQYDPKKGIKDYYNTLRRWAGQITNIPDKFTFKRQFVKGLPDYLIREMTKRGSIPDYVTVRTMVKTVQRYETDQSLLSVLKR
ncbi:hypothetical protein PQX77_017343 [Marasmius sp. AFHP31]|nr:hypothetical protein PQX77_017343 [Marasmius sp. AFHP31]